MNKLFKYILISLLILLIFNLPSVICFLTSDFCPLIPSLLYAYPDGWSDDILLTPEDMKQRSNPDLDVGGLNFVWAVWDSGNWANNTAEILYTKRDSLGNCLISETNISVNVPYSHLPRIAVDVSNNVQFIWRETSPQGLGIGHATLAHDGSVIIPSHLAVNGAGSGASSLLPEMVLNKYNEINMIWDESPSGYNQMNYTKLDSLGNPLISKIRVSPENIYAYWPGIGVDSFANIHMAYRIDSIFQNRLAYSKLDKDGNILISNKIFGTGLLPTIIADRSQNIHIVYEDPTGPGMSIEYLKLDQNANILVGSKILSIHEVNFRPHMAMDSLQYLHVVWSYDNFVDTAGIIYAKIDTLGDFVISPMPVVYPPYSIYPYKPRIAVDQSNKLHLIWEDQRLNPGVSTDIFYKRGENETGVQETKQLKSKVLPKISVFPNPFTTKTEIRFQISNVRSQRSEDRSQNPKIQNLTSDFYLRIYDVIGRKVKEFDLDESEDFIIWEGRDDFGNPLPAGVYFIQFADGSQSLPIILLR